MKTRRSKNVWRFGLMLAMLCTWGSPQLAGAGTAPPIPTGPGDAFNGIPDYYTTANWANSPPLAKFVDTLPGLGSTKANNLGQYLSVAKPDTVTYPGSDYYEINLVEYKEQMHSDMPNKTLLRGYVQVNRGTDTSICGGAAQPACSSIHNTLVPDPVHYLGPNIIAQRDRPVRIKFTNRLPSGSGGDLFIPVDTSVMGAGTGPASATGTRGVGAPCDNTVEPNNCASYTQNRADLHLHGGRTPWISDGTPHQWITPVEEITPFTKGVSFANVPDMPDPGDGSMTYYYTNQQSARLMFYHDHAFGITRLGVYAGGAAGYLVTDQWEQDLVNRNLIPPDQIPLIIQDKTFVDATPTTKFLYNTTTKLFDTPITVPQVRATDPLWNWGSAAPVNGIRPPVTGDLWLPHVYMPAQNSLAGSGGVNPFGRWMYGPWFYPATAVTHGPVANPYYDADCGSPLPAVYANCSTPGQPEQIPGTPNVSMGMEAFQDSAVVNGTVFPSLTVDPRAYRFRILNAASDRFWNLSFYVADPAQISPDTRPASRLTEVKMVPAAASLAAANNWPADWPVDGRDGGVPDPGLCAPGGVNCPNLGPSFLQIGTEGGFLPKPDVRNPQPVTYITDPTAFWVGIVDKTGLALGPAERADVVVDFSAYAGKTLILYNDAPAAWPARVPGYDYYTGAPDMRDSGGYGIGGTFNPITGFWDNGEGPQVGYAPNTRTVMQVIVRPSVGTDPAYTFNQASLAAEFTSAAQATSVNPAPVKTLFERAQEPIIVGQTAYAEAYPNSYFPPNYPWEGINQINDQFLKFVTLAGDPVIAPTEPKGIHDEMGASFDPVYGRMSGNLAMQLPNPTTLNALLILYGFSDLPTETINNSTSLNVTVIPDATTGFNTLGDGTQIWKISHNGVDTHPIHFHIFDVQLINRVGWDGQIAFPEVNELGWKDTVKISPLMDTIVAVRPRAPLLPFGITNSLRPLNPAIPIDSPMGFNSVDWQTGQARIPAVTNQLTNFGWEYVWHCHILSHEEMDMMRPIVLNVTSTVPDAPNLTSAAFSGSSVNLTWTDPTPANGGTTPGNPANEVGFQIQRCTGTACINFVDLDKALANATSYSDFAVSPDTTYRYRMYAFNAAGNSAPSAIGTATTAATIVPTVAITTPVNGVAFNFGETITINATATVPNGVTITSVQFYDGATLLATDTSAPYSFSWTNAAGGAHSLTAVVTPSSGTAVTSSAISVTVILQLPVAPALVGPSGPVSTATPTFSWNAVANATSYTLWNGNSGFTTYSAAAAGCPTGNGTCSATLITPLPANTTYYWGVKATNVSGSSPYSAYMSVIYVTPPVAPTLVGPNGTVATATPAFTWNAIANASSYTLWNGNSGFTTYTSAAAGCPTGTGTCSATLATPLPAGTTFYWGVKATNVSGSSPWSTFMPVIFGTPPVAPTLVGPNGTVAVATPTYTWNAVANANSYTLWNENSGFTTYTPAAAGCPVGTGTCSATLTTPLLAGTTFYWGVRASNDAGTSPWSAFMPVRF